MTVYDDNLARVLPRPTVVAAVPVTGEWRSEANIRSLVCDRLVRDGWSLRQAADTATRQRGPDIVAERHGARLHVGVKGYPSATYADPRRSGDGRRTQPTLQAKHWYADALLRVLRLRQQHPADAVAMAFPDTPRYRSLLEETASTLRHMRIRVFLVSAAGEVSAITP